MVLDGQEWRSPGVGPLSTGVAIDSGGRVRLLAPSELSATDRARGVTWAFQSFPTLLEGDGSVPTALRDTSLGVDLTHRDARLAIGVLRDGTVIIAMTRFDRPARVASLTTVSVYTWRPFRRRSSCDCSPHRGHR